MADTDERRNSIGANLEVPMVRKGGIAMNDAVLEALNVVVGETISFAPAPPVPAFTPPPAPPAEKPK